MSDSKKTTGLYNNGAYAATMPEIERGANIIKRHRVNYSVPQKVKFGMLPPSALDEYLASKEVAVSEEAEEIESNDNVVSPSENTKEEHHNHTFWEDDEGDRPQLSPEEYEAFLSQYSLSSSTVSPYSPLDDLGIIAEADTDTTTEA